MKNVRDALVCLLLLAGIVMGVSAALFLRAARMDMDALVSEAQISRMYLAGQLSESRKDLNEQLTGLRSDVRAEFDAARADVTGQLTGVRGELLGEVKAIHADAALRTAQAVDAVDTALSIVEEARDDARPVLVNSGKIAAQVNDALPLYLDCENNPDCAFNRFQGVSKATEQTMQAVAAAAPKLASSAVQNGENIAGITADAHTLTAQFAKPKTLKGKIWEGVKAVGWLVRFL